MLKSRTSKGKSKRKAGRPRRRLAVMPIDPATVDPRAILAAIAANPLAPPTARVAACKALLANSGKPPADDGEELPADVLTRRALELLQAGRPN